MVKCFNIFISSMFAILLYACNPFAPSVDDEIISPDKLLGNRTTINGLFEWFKNAYELKDTTLYGQALHKDFTFIYYDFDKNFEVSWNRDVEMRTSFNLFSSVQSMTLEWNTFLSLDTTKYQGSLERTFKLNIVMDQSNTFRGTGSARFKIQKDSMDGYWRIVTWVDKSDF